MRLNHTTKHVASSGEFNELTFLQMSEETGDHLNLIGQLVRAIIRFLQKVEACAKLLSP